MICRPGTLLYYYTITSFIHLSIHVSINRRLFYYFHYDKSHCFRHLYYDISHGPRWLIYTFRQFYYDVYHCVDHDDYEG